MNLRTVLAECPLFARLGPVAVEALAARAELIELPSGRTVIEQGVVCDSVYIVAAGRLSVVLADGSIVGSIARLEPVGEISALSGEPTIASVHAVRDSLLVRIPASHLYEVLTQHPQALIETTRVIIHRLRDNQRARHLERQRQMRCFAIVPATPAIDVTTLARQLGEALCASAACRPVLIDAAAVDAALGPGASQTRIEGGENNRRLVEHLNRIEADQTHLIYVAGGDADPWARRCMRQADRILFVVDTQTPPIATAMVDELLRCGARAPVDLIMVRPGGAVPTDVLRWRERVGAASHYYLRRDHAGDFASLARQITGRGVGLVLGGGGARGFAHIGLLRALRELDIPVDLVGGSSMGAFFAALIACGYDHHETAHIARETFVRQNHLNDYLFPTVALIRGRKFVRRLHEIFDERQIEALRMPFFCVSTNLTRGAAVVHDRGSLHLWVATSMAVPGVAPPVVWRGELLCDGAVVNSLPTDVMQKLERGPIIASDVSTEGGIAAKGIEGPDPEGLLKMRGDERPRLFSIMFRTATLTSESGTAQRAARADAYLRMPVSRIGMFDWKRMDEVVERGYRHAMEQLEPLRPSLVR